MTATDNEREALANESDFDVNDDGSILGIPPADDERAVLDRIIVEVTDLWDEPLDEVHDIPKIRNAILAAGFRRDAS